MIVHPDSETPTGLDDAHIANLPGPDAGHYLLLLAHPDGAIDVLNSRTQATAHYDAR